MPVYQKILVASDYSPDADYAVAHAAELARRYGAKLYVLHTLHTTMRYSPNQTDEGQPPRHAKDVNDQTLAEAQVRLRDYYQARAQDLDVVWLTRVGTPYVEILRLARKHGVDLIVLGQEGGDQEKWYGSTLARVSHEAHCPVLGVRQWDKATIRGQAEE